MGFWTDDKGSVFAIAAVSMLAIVAAVGTAVDLGRSEMVASKLQSAVDSAGLAACLLYTSPSPRD